jgi:methylenetetrahydrofolate reductase (NADPH)
MKIGEVFLRARKPFFSFEFFPPKSDAGVEKLLETARGLRVLDPAFVSVTYGAGGSNRARTFEVARRIKSELGIEVLAHVTCVGNTRDELRAIFNDLAAAGIENVMALRGDPPRGEARFETTPGGFSYASDLIEMLTREFDFGIGGAAYPEIHPEAESPQSDLEAAKRKVAAGAHFLTTQMFFDNESYFGFVERARDAGITVPIVPGIMPITSYEQIAIIRRCGAGIPQPLLAELEVRAGEPEAVANLGVAYCALQCAELLARGVPGIHFYTLNQSPATRAVVSALIAARTSNALLAVP